MSLGLALFVIALLTFGIIGLIFSFRRRKEKKWMIPLIIVLSTALLAFIVYALLTFILIGAADDPPSTQPSVSVTETTSRPTQTSQPETFTTLTTSTSPTTTVNTVGPEVEADPSQHPDV
ncbi:MAG TPA: hypothetical protein VFC89_02445, partial [Oscillospiraceae bacterium]|nr:hypothetical protein [Oscillospiraceae bacterium]